LSYELVDLGIAGEHSSGATAINNLGQVVGYSYLNGDQIGFLYDSGTTLNIGNLGYSSTLPYDVNDNGQVVGQSYLTSSLRRAFVYQNGVMTDIGTLESDSYSSASAINNSGQIVGEANWNNWGIASFIYSSSDGFDIYDEPNSSATRAFDIYNNGYMVGDISFASDPYKAYIYKNGNAEIIEVGAENKDNRALAINDDNQVLGYASFDGIGWRSYIFDDDTGSLDIIEETLAMDSFRNYGSAINNSGNVVGSSSLGAAFSGAGNHAFLYDGSSMLDLCVLVDCVAAGWDYLGVAYAIVIAYSTGALYYIINFKKVVLHKL